MSCEKDEIKTKNTVKRYNIISLYSKTSESEIAIHLKQCLFYTSLRGPWMFAI